VVRVASPDPSPVTLSRDAVTIAVRPQPVGLYPGPAGMLLLGPAADTSALAAILAGAAIDDPDAVAVPPEWRTWRDALAGITVTPGEPADALEAYNAFVLAPTVQVYATLDSHLRGDLRELLDVAAYACGVIDEPPEATPNLDHELLGLARATRAAWHIERGDPAGAIVCLEEAIAASRPSVPALAAQLLGQLAGLRAEMPLAIADLREAIALAASTASQDLLAGLWTDLGMLHQERGGRSRGALGEAVKAYQEAIHAGHTADRRPEQFGLLQNNIGLAYLSMPMVEASDQLRMAVAVQSFREALRMFPRETHPDMWASAQLNLANALQYLPSSHPAENLGKAVDIYEEILQVRNRAQDPVAYARVLANQANALAHLGGIVVALGKFREARGLATAAGAHDLADSLTEQIDALESHRLRTAPSAAGTPGGGTAAEGAP